VQYQHTFFTERSDVLPTRFDTIVGNKQLCDRLAQDVDRGTLSHAYIVEGPVGSGRKTLTLALISAICCEHHGSETASPCHQCKKCKRISDGISPDISFSGVGSDRVTIGIDTIRSIKEDIYTAPNELPIKAFIIEDADSMTEHAQNALLLILESPPPYVMFFLICKNSTSLLETVRSRAPTLRLERLPQKDVEKYLLENDSRARQLKAEDPKRLEFAVFHGEGAIGASLSLLNSKSYNTLADSKATAQKIISLLSSRHRSAAFEALAALGSKRADVSRQLYCLQVALRDLILLKKADGVRLCFFENREDAAELATHFSSSSLFSLYDAVADALSALEANANVRLTLISMMQNAGLI